MLSISSPLRGRGAGEYYLSLGREDYYLAGGEPPGKWFGRGAEKLGLLGEVKGGDFRSVFEGCYPKEAGRALVRNYDDKDRVSGWDLTFSAPKSVSVLWAVGDGDTRRAIQRAHEEAVKAALNYVEDVAGITRRGRGGVSHEKAGLIFATFEHGTSRAQDPQLHTHAVLLNVGVLEGGVTGAIHSKGVFREKMTAGVLYRAELSHRLRLELGVQTELDGRSFKVVGVEQGIVDEFSKRRGEIEAALDERGLKSAQAAAVAALDTRESKESKARAELFREWEEVRLNHGFGLEQVRLCLGRKEKEELSVNELIAQSVNSITERANTFTRSNLVRGVAERSQGGGFSAAEILSAIDSELLGKGEILDLGLIEGQKRYTTREILELEKRLLSRAGELIQGQSKRVSEETVSRVLESRPTMTEEQREAVKLITLSGEQLVTVTGRAGTGKTYMVDAVREILHAGGIEVVGAALQAQAARNLELQSGIRSASVSKTIMEIEAGRLELKKDTVLIVDEAGMIGTRQMERLLHFSAAAGSKLVLIGDPEQLQPVDAGGPYRALSELSPHRELKDIKRQREGWAREAVLNFAQGKGARALQEYAERGFITVKDSRVELMQSLINDWGESGGEKNLILAGRNRDVFELNRLAQEFRGARNELGEQSLKVGRERIYERDRVVFTKNRREVKNGEFGVVLSIDSVRGKMEVELDSGAVIGVSNWGLEGVRLGYASTTHKAQGATVDRAFVLFDNEMQDLHLSYVQASRARGETRFYVDREVAGEALANISRKVEVQRAKTLVHSLVSGLEEQALTGLQLVERIDKVDLPRLEREISVIEERARKWGLTRAGGLDCSSRRWSELPSDAEIERRVLEVVGGEALEKGELGIRAARSESQSAYGKYNAFNPKSVVRPLRFFVHWGLKNEVRFRAEILEKREEAQKELIQRVQSSDEFVQMMVLHKKERDKTAKERGPLYGALSGLDVKVSRLRRVRDAALELGQERIRTVLMRGRAPEIKVNDAERRVREKNRGKGMDFDY